MLIGLLLGITIGMLIGGLATAALIAAAQRDKTKSSDSFLPWW